MKKAVWSAIIVLAILLFSAYILVYAYRFLFPRSTGSFGPFKDGVYIGDPSPVPYGNVQVQIGITKGKIDSITMLQVPHAMGYTATLTARAFPVLIQEAITAQSSLVNGVSGATVDSEGFTLSLWSAISKAKI